MNPEKKWRRYTKVGDVFVNLTKYRARLQPNATGCLEWQGAKHRQGYGMVVVLDETGKNHMTVAHRIAMRLKLGREISSKEDVKHTCGNNLCCNPAHLQIRNEEKSNDTKTITDTEISAYAK